MFLVEHFCASSIWFWEFTLPYTPPPPPQKTNRFCQKRTYLSTLLLGKSSKSSEKSSASSPSFPMARWGTLFQVHGGRSQPRFVGSRVRTRKEEPEMTGENHIGNQTLKSFQSCSRWWFQIFFSFTSIWGGFPFWRAYLSDGLVQPPTSFVCLRGIFLGPPSDFWTEKFRWLSSEHIY